MATNMEFFSLDRKFRFHPSSVIETTILESPTSDDCESVFCESESCPADLGESSSF